MEFLTHLREVERDEVGIIRLFRPIRFASGVELSVQGSRVHYSTPRAILDDPSEYETMEVAFKQDGSFVEAETVLAELGDATLGLIYEMNSDDMVSGFFPLDAIERMFQAMKATYGGVVS